MRGLKGEFEGREGGICGISWGNLRGLKGELEGFGEFGGFESPSLTWYCSLARLPEKKTDKLAAVSPLKTNNQTNTPHKHINSNELSKFHSNQVSHSKLEKFESSGLL